MTWSRVKTNLGPGVVQALVVRGDSIAAVGARIWLGPVDGIGDDGLYPELPCGAPNPDTPYPRPTAAPGESPIEGPCYVRADPAATDEVPEGFVPCEDVGIECPLPDDPPPVVFCEPAIPAQ